MRPAECNRILLVEDEQDILIYNAEKLRAKGYVVDVASTLAQAREAVREHLPDLAVLDVLLPDGSGMEFCQELRALTIAPVIFLTILSEQDQIIAGLQVGGDDYLIKPYHFAELLARIEAQLRRATLLWCAGNTLKSEGLELDLVRQRARWRGRELSLKPKEFQLLTLLAKNKNRYATAAELYMAAWGMVACDTRPVIMHISSLRVRLREETDGALEVQYSRQRGYRLTFANDETTF